jgi:hypothetical protein
MTLRILAAAFAVACAAAPAAQAQENAEELAKKLANPIASLISAPFQTNYDRGFGPDDDGERVAVNIQPVVPFQVGEDWNLISRTILPVAWQDDLAPGSGTQFGLGDTVQSFFLSPRTSRNGVTGGVGSAVLLPTATDDAVGSGKVGIGPTAVALKQTGPWTVGALGNHIWSVAGEGERAEVNSSFLQPFLSFTSEQATTFTLASEITYDWRTEQAAVPVNALVNQLFTVGGQRVQLGAGVRYWLDSPDGGPEGFGGRLNLVFLFPR